MTYLQAQMRLKVISREIAHCYKRELALRKEKEQILKTLKELAKVYPE